MIPRVFTVCLLCSFLVDTSLGAPQPDPQRSVQLGGAGPRPVALNQIQGGPIYTQQLAFGPAQPQLLQPSPTPSQQGNRIRVPQGLQSQQQQQFPQGGPSPQARPFALQPFPGAGAPVRQQPIILKSPASQQEEEEYDEDEYEDEPAAAPAPKPQPSPRPQVQRGPPARINPQSILINQQSPQPGPGGQRFIVPQQIQPQIRRPVQQRVIPSAPIQVVTSQPQLQGRQPSQRPTSSLGSDSRLKNRVSTPPPIQTINRFMRNNPDGSITWGYENEDGTFKEETLGADCVVRGKYGYVDPDGNKREYEYQQGNPCDPNKKDEPEEDEEVIGGPSSQQKLGGLLTARPGQLQGRRPVQVYQ
ncbi:unnamed protein product [Allacma fusca]|uniref:Uncharacterized protein n=1 Tax=Allacma fusca TaxID=39272 RepID=A0A8J2JGI9_9HEXA|nr:unnamed protein product [Allacma fusca]